MLSLIYANQLINLALKVTNVVCKLKHLHQLNKITDIKFSTFHSMQRGNQVQCLLTSRLTRSACTTSSTPGAVTSSHFSWCALGTVSGTRMTYTP